MLEKIRADKVIGHSLDAHVDIYADADLYEFLKVYESELAGLFIVSEVELHPEADAPEGVYASDTVAGLKVGASPATGLKCERCWCKKKDVGLNAKHPALCARCASVLSE